MRTYHNKGKRIVLENPFVIGNTLETKSTEIKAVAQASLFVIGNTLETKSTEIKAVAQASFL
jgi:hypothetical protein